MGADGLSPSRNLRPENQEGQSLRAGERDVPANVKRVNWPLLHFFVLF